MHNTGCLKLLGVQFIFNVIVAYFCYGEKFVIEQEDNLGAACVSLL